MKNINGKIRNILFSLILCCAWAFNFEAQAYEDDDVAKAMAEFIEALVQNTQTVNRGNSLCIFGSDDISSYLLATEKNALTLEEDVNKKQAHKSCRIIYVAKNKEKFVRSFISILNQSGAPTVAVFESFVNNGGMIFIDIGRRDFELTLNLPALKASGAKLDSSITSLISTNKTH